jgi:hypothetical protein
LNNIHFLCAHREKAEVKPCWITFHKGEVTGWSEGGIKRFVGLHEKKKSGDWFVHWQRGEGQLIECRKGGINIKLKLWWKFTLVEIYGLLHWAMIWLWN